MATIKRTVTDNNGILQYITLHDHCSHASAAGSFQANTEGALICSKHPISSTLVKFNGNNYLFEEL